MGSNWNRLFQINGKGFVCIVDYFSEFPMIKQVEKSSADSLVVCHKSVLEKYGLPKKMSDMGTNFKWEIQKLLLKNKYQVNSVLILPS